MRVSQARKPPSGSPLSFQGRPTSAQGAGKEGGRRGSGGLEREEEGERRARREEREGGKKRNELHWPVAAAAEDADTLGPAPFPGLALRFPTPAPK